MLLHTSAMRHGYAMFSEDGVISNNVGVQKPLQARIMLLYSITEGFSINLFPAIEYECLLRSSRHTYNCPTTCLAVVVLPFSLCLRWLQGVAFPCFITSVYKEICWVIDSQCRNRLTDTAHSYTMGMLIMHGLTFFPTSFTVSAVRIIQFFCLKFRQHLVGRSRWSL